MRKLFTGLVVLAALTSCPPPSPAGGDIGPQSGTVRVELTLPDGVVFAGTEQLRIFLAESGDFDGLTTLADLSNASIAYEGTNTASSTYQANLLDTDTDATKTFNPGTYDYIIWIDEGVDNTVNTGDWVYPAVNADFGSVTVDGNQIIIVGDSVWTEL
jgi:hypothetical protein